MLLLWCPFAAAQEIQQDLALVQQQMSHLATERYLAQVGPVDEATAAALESGAAVPWNQDTAAIIAVDAAVSQEQAMTGLQGVLDTWQQELQVFREVGGWGGLAAVDACVPHRHTEDQCMLVQSDVVNTALAGPWSCWCLHSVATETCMCQPGTVVMCA